MSVTDEEAALIATSLAYHQHITRGREVIPRTYEVGVTRRHLEKEDEVFQGLFRVSRTLFDQIALSIRPLVETRRFGLCSMKLSCLCYVSGSVNRSVLISQM